MLIPIADARVLAIPVEDCGEPLVDLRAEQSIRVDERNAAHSRFWCHARAGVAERLRRAQAALPAPLALLVVEAYRPLDLQRRYFERDLERAAGLHPDWEAPKVREFVSRYVAPPDALPPHSTGAAVDLTLADGDGRELDIGSRINADPEEGDGACHTDAPDISEQARANRSLLVEVMAGAGFANYPAEWWHWSYGDRYWAYVTGTPAAIYGAVKPPARTSASR